MKTDTQWLEEEAIDLVLQEEATKALILYNDDVNTFDHVIETLILVCEHTEIQAEQCAILVHYKGKCTVKTGEYEKLKVQCTQLLDAGLSQGIKLRSRL